MKNSNMNVPLIKLKVDNSRIMDSIENAYLKVTSPTGKSIYLYKNKLSRATQKQTEVFWKFCNDPMIEFIGEMEATKDEMDILLNISNLK